MFTTAPKSQLTNLLAKKCLVLFSENKKLIDEVASAVKNHTANFIVLTNVPKQKPGDNEQDPIYLIDDTLRSIHPIALIENLYFQDTSSAANIALIAEKQIDLETEAILKRYNLRGYIPRKGLSKLLISHLKTLLEDNSPFRKNIRIRTSFPVNIALGKLRLQGTCTSFSESGMFIQANAAPPEKEDFNLSFTLPGFSDSNVVRGHILYSSPVGFAVHFKPKVRELVRALISNM
jgi:hypothetical protein